MCVFGKHDSKTNKQINKYIIKVMTFFINLKINYTKLLLVIILKKIIKCFIFKIMNSFTSLHRLSNCIIHRYIYCTIFFLLRKHH